MPQERSNVAGSTRRAVPLGLLGMLALVVLVEGGLAGRGDAIGDWMSLTWRSAGRWARGTEARADLLCLGDSLIKEGVLPRVLGRGLGVSVYNLAIHGGSAPSSYFLLRRSLRNGARPRAVVVDFHPNLLATAPRSSAPYWSDLVDARDAIDLGWNARDPDLFVRTVVFGLLPSLKNRDTIRADLSSAWRGGTPEGRGTCRALARNFRENLGARVSPVTPPPADPEAYFRTLSDRGRWKPNPVNVAYMRRFFALAERSGVLVFWLLPPTSPAWQGRREKLGADASYEALARALQAGYRNVVVVDGRFAGYGASAFHDLTHLHVVGATELSESLATSLSPYLAPAPPVTATWAALPRFRGLPRGRLPEDLDQSRIAVVEAGSLRR